MNRIIDIGDIHSNSLGGNTLSFPPPPPTPQIYIKLLWMSLLKNNPNKITFTLKEAAGLLNVGEEFIRRRMKSGAIKVTYFGDKPIITHS